MIAYLKGKIIQKNIKSVVVFNSGLGYEVFLSEKDLQATELGQENEFFIHSYIKEDAFDLYGFKNFEALDFFRKLISVSGVGPKGALSVLALAKVGDLKRAITSGDYQMLQKVSGIGKKTAQRIVVELKEKFISDVSGKDDISFGDNQLIDALVSLGYKEAEARDMTKNLPVGGDLATRLKAALKTPE